MKKTTRITYWQIFRLIFVLFFLYLMRDAFYRWDGVRYYASFTEFLPGVALITIFWTMMSAFTAVLILFFLKAFHWVFHHMEWKVKIEHLSGFLCIFLVLGAVVWVGKRYMWTDVQTSLQIKLTVFLCVAILSVLLTWLLRNKLDRWIDVLQERITPLVWIFGIWFILSVPLVVYHTWIKQTDDIISQKRSHLAIPGARRPNIILVTFDVLTTRDMSVYGYYRPTTPFITGWAKKASLFTGLRAESNFTTPAIASIMTGKRVWTHQTYHLEGSKPVRGSTENLPLMLKKNNYYTIALVANSAASVRVLGIADSFDIAPHVAEFNNTPSLFVERFGVVDTLLFRLFGDRIRKYDWIRRISEDNIFLDRLMDIISDDFSETTRPPEKAFNRFLSIIDNNIPKPYFAWIHLHPPHDPYLPPDPYMGMYNSSLELRTFKSQEKASSSLKSLRHQSKYYQQFPQDVQPIVDIQRARFDEFIRYCDKQFEDFIAQLRERNILSNTIVILSSDHGESFEHSYLGHSGPYLYEPLTRIPLIIMEPDQRDGRVIDKVVEQIDLPATILDLVDIPVPSWMEGRSLVPLMRGKSLSEQPAFSMNFERNFSRGHQITRGTIAVWEDNYKLIHYLEEKESLLFNLKQDPDEIENLFDKEHEIGQRLLGLIQDNLRNANDRISRGE